MGRISMMTNQYQPLTLEQSSLGAQGLVTPWFAKQKTPDMNDILAEQAKLDAEQVASQNAVDEVRKDSELEKHYAGKQIDFTDPAQMRDISSYLMSQGRYKDAINVAKTQEQIDNIKSQNERRDKQDALTQLQIDNYVKDHTKKGNAAGYGTGTLYSPDGKNQVRVEKGSPEEQNYFDQGWQTARPRKAEGTSIEDFTKMMNGEGADKPSKTQLSVIDEIQNLINKKAAPLQDNQHPGMKKQINKVTGETRWVPQ